MVIPEPVAQVQGVQVLRGRRLVPRRLRRRLLGEAKTWMQSLIPTRYAWAT